jgi:hypothetical protein
VKRRLWSEIGGQEGFRGRDRGEPVEAQLRDEPIPQRGPEPFDAPLGLGRVRGDVANVEVAQDLAELRGMLPPRELFLEAPVGIIPDEDAEAIAVEGHRQAVPLGQPLQQGEIAMQVLGGAEVEREDGAGGVVDGAEEQQGRPRAEPVERAAVDQGEAAHGRMPGAAVRCCGGRRRRFGGRPSARRRRRTVSRLTARPSTSRSFSVQWQSLNSR